MIIVVSTQEIVALSAQYPLGAVLMIQLVGGLKTGTLKKRKNDPERNTPMNKTTLLYESKRRRQEPSKGR